MQCTALADAPVNVDRVNKALIFKNRSCRVFLNLIQSLLIGFHCFFVKADDNHRVNTGVLLQKPGYPGYGNFRGPLHGEPVCTRTD